MASGTGTRVMAVRPYRHATDVTGETAHRDNAVMGHSGPGGLGRRTLDVAGVQRTY
jgi:hypothetical protein